MVAGVYAIENAETGKAYVGSSRDIARRYRRHVALLRAGKHHSSKLQRSWDKHGEGAFGLRILDRISDDAAIFAAEQKWIDALNAHAGGYNSIGRAGRVLPYTPEQRAEMSARLQGRIHTPEARRKLSEAHTGKIVSAATRSKLRAANLGKKNGPHSDESRAKMSAAKRGKKNSPEHIEKTRAARIGTTASEETKARMRIAQLARWAKRERSPMPQAVKDKISATKRERFNARN